MRDRGLPVCDKGPGESLNGSYIYRKEPYTVKREQDNSTTEPFDDTDIEESQRQILRQ